MIQKNTLNLLLITCFVLSNCSAPVKEKYQVQNIVEEGYSYKMVADDPTGLRIYTLKNGLKVYMSVNKNEPKVQTCIAVKAGSTYDPAENTGLAHYLEHMLFKGTDKIGTLDWEKEEALLKQISDLYEAHRNSNDEEVKKSIYQQIDSVSNEASKYAIANELDKMVSGIGGTWTNAYTSNEETVYINTIPSNEFEKWLQLESERFGKLVLRLFHTELESVYEEFNIGQDSDGRKAYHALFRNLFPNHPYGTQTTIGTSEHLKNPSMVKINEYFDKYYVANNMAICLSGDLDPVKTIKLIDRHFGDMRTGEVPVKEKSIADPIQGKVVDEVLGPEEENVMLAYRFDGVNSRDKLVVGMIDMLLSNSQAGIIDLDLVQSQKILSGGCSPYFLKEYGAHLFYGTAREGQTLEEVEELLLSTIEKIKMGDFPDWLMEAVINDLELDQIKKSESISLAYEFVDAFIHEIPWEKRVAYLDEMRKLTKEELVKFANDRYKGDYVAIYKRTGKDSLVAKVDKPPITPIELNRGFESSFLQNFKKQKSDRLSPVFINFNEKISQNKLNEGVNTFHIANEVNDLFSLYYIFDMGNWNDRSLSMAFNYANYLGTSKYSPAELQQEWYKLGVSMDVFSSNNRSYVYIKGLGRSLGKAIDLLEHVLSDVQSDQEAYNDFVDGILKKRKDGKLNKRNIIWRGLLNMAKYGSKSPFSDIVNEEDLRAFEPGLLTDKIKNLKNYKHDVFYYGKKTQKEINSLLDERHAMGDKLMEYPEKRLYPEIDIEGGKVYFSHYDMVQAQVILLAKDESFNKELMPYARVLNEYFGGGLSSIIFQEIRESKGLAYSAFCSYSTPSQKENSHYIRGYIGTQLDKLPEALPAMVALMREMPKAEMQFQSAKEAVLKQLETERITKSLIFWTYKGNLDKGIDYDIRKDIYQTIQSMTLDDLDQFFRKHVAEQKYSYLVLSNRDEINKDVLNSYGEIKEYSLEELFGY